MKKTLALLLCLAMLFTALTVNVFADENPTVTIETSSVSENGETSFAIKFAGYTSLKGYDLVIKAGTGLNLLSASALNAETDLDEGVNYKIENNELHIVELTKVDGDDIITVNAKFAENQTAAVKVEVIKCDLAESSSQLYAAATIADVTIAPYVKPVSVTVPAIPDGQQTVKIEQSAAGEGYFIPYGSVYTVKDGVYNYKSKDESGKFDVTADTIVQAFKLPEDGFATFGVSDSAVEEEDAKQFGNITTSYTKDKKYGTLVFIGQWEAFKDHNLSKKGYSEKVLVEKLYAAYNAANPDGKYTFVSFKSGDAVIRVYDVAQKNWMWKNETDGILEYAVRVYGLVGGTEYAAVAYNIDGETVNFANGVKSVSYNAQ
jgi:hypothetical protein